MATNKQPIFTANPIFRCASLTANSFGTFNPAEPSTNAVEIFRANDRYGTLIERVTLTAMADPYTYPNVSAKIIYLIAYSNVTDKYAILKTDFWPATVVSNNTPPPSTEFTFNGGLLLEYNLGADTSDKLYITQCNSSNGAPTDNGDGIAWALEGSTYGI